MGPRWLQKLNQRLATWVPAADLKNTFLAMIADHGTTYGTAASTILGHTESRNPIREPEQHALPDGVPVRPEGQLLQPWRGAVFHPVSLWRNVRYA